MSLLTSPPPRVPDDLMLSVERSLAEDIGSGDVTAQLVPAGQGMQARIIAREAAVLCGQPWVNAVFSRLDPTIQVQWQFAEGAAVEADQVICTLQGPARALLTGERTALNFLQTLSGTATAVRQFVRLIEGTGCRIADTRKTLPGLRNAQKYAVLHGGGLNHRIGLYDGILIKENHIGAAGGIAKAIANARALEAQVPLMTEAEDLDEARIAIEQDVDLLLIDDFTHDMIRTAVAMVRAHRAAGGKTVLEYSGGANVSTVRAIAELGVDRISVGAITKHLHAIDLSMRFVTV